MKQKFLAAAVQMVSGSDVTANLQRAAHWVAEAAAKGARLVVLPEYFCLMGKQETDKVAVCEPTATAPSSGRWRGWRTRTACGWRPAPCPCAARSRRGC